MQSPFWAQNENYVAAHLDFSCKDDQAASRSENTCASLGENIHALVCDGLAPGVVPEGIGVVAGAVCAFYGHGEVLGEEEARQENEEGEKAYFFGCFHEEGYANSNFSTSSNFERMAVGSCFFCSVV